MNLKTLMPTILGILLMALAPSGFARGGEIHDAARTGNVERIQALVQKDPGLLRAKDEHGATALFTAAMCGEEAAARRLLAMGADPDATADNGATPLHAAVYGGLPELVSLLLDRGVQVDARDHKGRTPLHMAAWQGQKASAGLLLARGAAIDARDQEGDTPLHWAALSGSLDVAALLLAKGADPRALDQDGETPLHAAARWLNEDLPMLARKRLYERHRDIAVLLLDRHVEIDPRNRKGYTPLLLAVEGNLWDLIDALVARGADINARNQEGKTPLGLALSLDRPELAARLREHGAHE